MTAKPAGWIIVLLAAIVATTPLAIDMYLPAMPLMAQQLNTSIGMVQQSLSIFLAFFGISMLLCGPLADSLGRRPLAIFGLTGFVLASIALSQVSSIEWFLFWRAIQALCGAAATVVVPGIVRHIYQEHTAKGMSYVSMIMMLAPLLAPAIGSGILWLANWQMIFVTLAAYAALVLLVSIKALPEIKAADSPKKIALLAGYKIVFANKSARPDIATSMFASFSFFCFLTAVPFVYIQFFGVDEQQFSVLFGFNVLMLMLANLINSRLVTRLGPQRMLRAGLALALVSASALTFFSLWQLELYYTVLAIAPLMACLSLIATNADAMILMKFPDNSGSATAVIGTLRFGIGALAGPLLALFYTGTAVPFALLMLAGVLLIAVSQLWHTSGNQTAG
ncbi:MAG: Bcr/CflA family efflux MFS transporter [Gammaproteobacteria bacterium]|nr:Bcr/CflA family efflux MFS transporter [Gammaproteobacteria bacterium]MBU1554687.1 Bcr/CflA family efflux MFS transporter [Gammaproteobacteria bacterium]MBU2069928.1 Bcr/CflA family efflux MFS transporter [Gammaproteobacteria bacterium]MBU2185073.1 Bcr/CflA family efflux MFS transporter [Gammaproteobacteria bacterium]MBU2206941.1 Bcr/CflA family efflux MFS transporter [Gammaproteobacteria bacterium]